LRYVKIIELVNKYFWCRYERPTGACGCCKSVIVLEGHYNIATDSNGRLTKERSRYAHLWIVVQRLEEVFIGHSDVPHPVEQILRPAVVEYELQELASDRHVRRAFGDIKTVRSRVFECPLHPTSMYPLVQPMHRDIPPRELEKVRKVTTTDKHVKEIYEYQSTDIIIDTFLSPLLSSISMASLAGSFSSVFSTKYPNCIYLSLPFTTVYAPPVLHQLTIPPNSSTFRFDGESEIK